MRRSAARRKDRNSSRASSRPAPVPRPSARSPRSTRCPKPQRLFSFPAPVPGRRCCYERRGSRVFDCDRASEEIAQGRGFARPCLTGRRSLVWAQSQSIKGGASTMFVLEARSERIAILALTVLMAATRIEHFGAGQIAPDASTAVFFLAGLLIGNPLWLLAFLAEALLLDLTAIHSVGVEAVCVTFGYGMMIPAYGALWLAARWVRKTNKLDVSSVA